MFTRIKNKISDWFTDKLVRKFAGTAIRGALIGLGTYIGSKSEFPGSDYLSELLLTNVEQYTDKIVGALLAGIGILLSLKEKVDTVKNTDVALKETIDNLAKEDLKWLAAVKTKPGVSLHKLKPPILDLLKVTLQVHEKYGYTMTVTSTFEGKHMKNSLHYQDLAFDSRVWGIPKSDQRQIREDIILALKDKADDYDIVIESSHIHYEYDPK